MPKYHLNKRLREPVVCTAKFCCPLGGETGFEEHFDTREEAMAWFENEMKSKVFSTMRKNASKVEVSRLPSSAWLSDHQMQVKGGVYVVCDPSIMLRDHPDVFRRWLDVAESTGHGLKDAVFGAKVDEYPVYAAQLPQPGQYEFDDGVTRDYPWGAAALVPVDLLKRIGLTDQQITSRGSYAFFPRDQVLASTNDSVDIGSYQLLRPGETLSTG